MTASKLLFFSAFLTASAALAQNPVLTLSNTTVVFNYVAGNTTLPDPQTVTISTNPNPPVAIINGATISYSPGSSGWLTIPPSFGATPLMLSLYVNPGGLAPGNYAATVQLTATAALDPTSTTTFAVFLIVSPAGGGGGPPTETISVSPASLNFTVQGGAGTPLPQLLTISTSDNAPFSVTTNTNDGGSWLSVNPPTSNSPGGVLVSVNPAGLTGASYTGTLTIRGSSAISQVTVTLTLTGFGLSVNPSNLAFNIPQNYGFGASQSIQVTSSVPATITAIASSDNNWLVVDNPMATTPATIVVRANDASLAQGTYMGTVTVQTTPNNAVQVPVVLTVGAPATLQLQPGSLTFNYQAGSTLPPAPVTVKVNSLTAAVQTFSIASSTSDGGSWLSATASPATTPGIVTVTVNPASLGVGTYVGAVNVTPAGAGASSQPIAVTLNVLPIPPPVVSGVTSSASYAVGTVAPGEFVTIFGKALGPAVLAVAPPGALPPALVNTAVTFDGIAAPIIYTSATQVSVQVPYGIAIGQTIMKIAYQGNTSAMVTLNSAPTAPGLFTVDSSGKGAAAALNASSTGSLTLNSPANPAARGSVLVLYGTGEGKTNPPIVEGTITPSVAPFPQAIATVTATVGGQAATVQYAGETPSVISGLFQINVVVPPTTAPGPAVPVQVFVGGQPTQGNVTVAIN